PSCVLSWLRRLPGSGAEIRLGAQQGRTGGEEQEEEFLKLYPELFLRSCFLTSHPLPERGDSADAYARHPPISYPCERSYPYRPGGLGTAVPKDRRGSRGPND